MDGSDVLPDPLVLAQDELLALLEPKTGPVADLRLRLIDQRGRFAWTGTVVGTGEAITGTCALALATDGVNIWTEVEEIVVLGRGVIRRMRWPSTTSWAETIGRSASMIDTTERDADDVLG